MLFMQVMKTCKRVLDRAFRHTDYHGQSDNDVQKSRLMKKGTPKPKITNFWSKTPEIPSF